MKRIVIVIVSLIMGLMVLSSCEKDNVLVVTEPDTENTIDSKSEPVEPTVISMSKTTTNKKFMSILAEEEYEQLWPGTKRIVWLTDSLYSPLADRNVQIHFNNLLLKKNADFIVQFIGNNSPKYDSTLTATYYKFIRDLNQANAAVDIINTGTGHASYPATYISAVQDGLLEPLDSYLMAEQGQKLLNAHHDKLWEMARIKGQIYGISPVELNAYPTMIYFNRDSVEQYKLQVPSEITNLNQLEPILKEVKRHYPYPLRVVGAGYRELVQLSFMDSGIAVLYNGDGTRKAVNPFAEPDIQEMLLTLDRFDKAGYLQNLRGSRADEFVVLINRVYSTNSYYQGLLRQLPDSSEEEVIALTLRKGEVFTMPNAVTGIASWSENKADAFKLLSMLHTDQELSNLVTYGIEGLDYAAGEDEQARQEHLESLSGRASFGNEWITHRIGIQPEDKYKLMDELYDDNNVIVSATKDFELDAQALGIEDELEQIKTIYAKYELLWGPINAGPTEKLTAANKELQAAGIDRVLDIINQQLAAADAEVAANAATNAAAGTAANETEKSEAQLE